ncbi:MAG: pilus assembly protein TadG-related protein [Acidimicrobiales bacterium]|jgi:Flp pilus assembly protein TadG|nr:pilus assembly protein TadG-related protein [Acidimicrobiales bacterium]
MSARLVAVAAVAIVVMTIAGVLVLARRPLLAALARPGERGTRRGALRRSEAGMMTIWMVGLCSMVLFLVGISFDLWRAVSAQRSLSTAVDGAAVAGASGIDEDVYRASEGRTVQLEPARARDLAAQNLASQDEAAEIYDVVIDTEPTQVRVEAARQVEFTLLRVFMSDQGPLVLHASSTVTPRRSG